MHISNKQVLFTMDAMSEQDGPSTHPWGAFFVCFLFFKWLRRRSVTFLPECIDFENEFSKQPAKEDFNYFKR